MIFEIIIAVFVTISVGYMIHLSRKIRKEYLHVLNLTNFRLGSICDIHLGDGGCNTACGVNSLCDLTSGSGNTTFGANTAQGLLEGDLCIHIGNNTKPSKRDAKGEIVIGNGAQGEGDNIIVIGSKDTKKIVIYGKLEVKDEGQ